MMPRTRNAVILLAILGAVIATLSVLDSSAFYVWQQKRMVRRVLAANPIELRDAGRTFLVADKNSSAASVFHRLMSPRPFGG